MPRPDQPSNSRVLWVAALGTICSGIALAAVGLLLAMLGAFEPMLAAMLCMPLAIGMVVVVRRVAPAPGSRDVWAIAACVIAAGAFLWNSAHAADQAVADRSAGVIAAQAASLQRNDDLRLTSEVGGIDGVTGLTLDGGGAEAVNRTTVEVETPHAAAVLTATWMALFGFDDLGAFAALSSSLGLLALYLAARRLFRHPLTAVVAVAIVASSLPFVVAARDITASSMCFAVVAAALAVATAHGSHVSPVARAALTGALIGAAALFERQPATFAVATIAVVAGLTLVGVSHRVRRAFALGAGPGLVVALVDLAGFAGTELAGSARMVIVILVVAGAAYLAVEMRWSGAGEPEGDRAVEVPINVCLGWALGLAALWRVTQLVDVLGIPAVVIGVIGIAVFLRGSRDREPFVTVTVLGLCIGASIGLVMGTGGGLLERPGFDEFVPVAGPALVIFGLLAIEQAADRLLATSRRADPGIARAGLVALGALLIAVPAVIVTWPLRSVRYDQGMRAGFNLACGTIGPRATVILYHHDDLAMPLRGWCAADLAIGDPTEAPRTLQQLRAANSVTCSRIFVMSPVGGAPPGTESLLVPIIDIGVASDTAIDLNRDRPRALEQHTLTIQLAELLLPDSCAAAPAA